MRRAVVGSLALGVLAGSSWAPGGRVHAQEPPAPVFPARSEAVTVDVVVLDAQGVPVKGLTRGDFVVREDGSPRTLVAFREVAFAARETPPALEATTVATNDDAQPDRAVYDQDLHAQTSGVERLQHDEAQKAYELGQELMQRESFEEAAIHFKTAIKLDPMHWLAHYGLGQASMALKRYPEAVQAYLGCRDALVRFASLDTGQQNTLDKAREDEIREVQDSLLRVQQGKIKTGSPLSLEVRLQDRLRVLEGSRLRGKEQKVGVPAGLMLGLGSAYFRSGQMAEAQASFLEAVEIDPRLGPAHNNLAVMYMMSGDFVKAKEEVRRAEKAGTRVSDAFKQELERRAREGEKPR